MFRCPNCQRDFKYKKNLKTHFKTKHTNNDESIQNETSKTTSDILSSKKNCNRIHCTECECIVKDYATLRQHICQDHNINLEKQNLQFKSKEDFWNWKASYEGDNKVSYILNTSQKNKTLYYHCHRSYEKNCKTPNEKIRKTVKIGKTCPSTLTATIDEDSVNVVFYKTHVGHSIDLGKVFLSNEERVEIAGMLKQGVSMDHILDNVRSSVDEKLGLRRIHLLDKKDLHNIKACHRITYNTQRHKDDATSVKLWVEDMKELDDDCPVIYFKEQGQLDTQEHLLQDDFVLIIMTSFQKQQLQKFGRDKICIDGTYGTNAYDFQLFTLMTVDEFGSGCPVAFLFSNKADELVFEVFFRHLTKKIGAPIKCNVFMSDDAPAFYNAWCLVMGNVPHQLLCSWHVDRNWQKNLTKISGGVEKKAAVYKALKTIQHEQGVEEFKILLSQFMRDLFDDPNTLSFGKYFETCYAGRTELWAFCYRVGLGINTNMYLESLHKILKHNYMKGKNVKRLDKTIDALIQMSRDYLFKRIIKIAKHGSSTKLDLISKSHSAGCKIEQGSIQKIDKESWLVMSSAKNNSNQYFVTKMNKIDICQGCPLICKICNICVHDYKCSCMDNLIKFNICKHIHSIVENTKTVEESVLDVSITSNSYSEENLENLFKYTYNGLIPGTLKLNNTKKITKKLEFIMGALSQKNITDDECRSVENHLDKVINILNHSNKNKSFVENTTESINTNAKITPQTRFFSTKKKRTSASTFKKPTPIQSKNIAFSLKNSSSSIVDISTDFDHSYSK